MKIFKTGVSMFTMKKFAVLAVAGFLAASTIGCSDPTDDEGDDSSSSGLASSPSAGSNGWTLDDLTGAGWIKKTTTLGGTTSTTGSFLDIDGTIKEDGSGDVAVYLRNQAAANKDVIDLIYDGTNIYTPQGCIEADPPCPYKTQITGSANKQAFLTKGVSPAQSACTTHSAFPGNNPATFVNNYAVEAAGAYYLATSEGSRALVLIGQQGSGTVGLVIGYLYSPKGCTK